MIKRIKNNNNNKKKLIIITLKYNNKNNKIKDNKNYIFNNLKNKSRLFNNNDKVIIID